MDRLNNLMEDAVWPVGLSIALAVTAFSLSCWVSSEIYHYVESKIGMM